MELETWDVDGGNGRGTRGVLEEVKGSAGVGGGLRNSDGDTGIGALRGNEGHSRRSCRRGDGDA